MNEFDYLAKAKDKMCDEKYVEAKSLCDKAIKINSELPCAYNCRGNANYELGYYDEAIEDFAKAIEKEPNNAEHYYDRSWAYNQISRSHSAMIDINIAIKLEPNNSHFYYSRARFEYDLGRYKEAIEDYTKGIEIKPTEKKYLNRADCYMELEMHDSAIADYTSAIEIEPESYVAFHRRGLVKMELEQFQEAIKDFEKAVEIFPEAAYSLVQIGYARIALGKKDAMKYFNKAVKVFPDADIYLERVKARVKILLRETALENLAQNKDICTDFFDRKLFNEKQAQDDIKDLNKALKDDPDNTEALELRADRYYYLKEFDKSVTDCVRLIDLEPENARYFYALALAYKGCGKFQEVIDNCQKSIELNGNKIDTEVFSLKAEAEYKLKQYDKVVDDLNISLTFEESDRAYYYRGLAHYKLGHYRRAVSDIKKSIELKHDVLETYDDKLPKLLEFVVNILREKEDVGANGKNENVSDTPKEQKSKSERPISIAGLRKLQG